jgi:hypothetical protein
MAREGPQRRENYPAAGREPGWCALLVPPAGPGQELIQMMRLVHVNVQRRLLLPALAAVLASVPVALGRQAPNATPAELLEDFVHYTLIAKPDLAAASAQRLLEAVRVNAELTVLLDESDDPQLTKRFDDAALRAQGIPELEPIASELAHRMEQGRHELARDLKRIDEAMAMLRGTRREVLLGEKRILSAGEYAVPSLLKAITSSADAGTKRAAEDMLRQIGAAAVVPLSEAIFSLDGLTQRIVCDILGGIGAGAAPAAPFLKELSDGAAVDGPARDAASRAFRQIGATEAAPATLYSALARRYLAQPDGLVPHPYETHNNVWTHNPFRGLEATSVPTPIYNEVMAMRRAMRALQLDAPANAAAVTTFVAANLKRENELPAGAADPFFGDARYSPGFYATVYGTQTCLDVLGIALDMSDTLLVRDAIRALSQTTGGANLFARGGSRQPLVEALGYPDRRVQYDAALTLARALPQQTFASDTAVVPLLASAVRTGSQSFAIVLAIDPEDRRVLAGELEKLRFHIIGTGSYAAELRSAIIESPGVDLVLIRADSADEARAAVDSARAQPKAAVAPILILAAALDVPGLAREFHGDPRIRIARDAIGPEARTQAIEAVMHSASGGRMTEAESESYAIAALEALHDVAISGSPAYRIADAEPALVDALDVRTGGTRLRVADILARIDSDRAQRRLFDAALAATGDEQLDLLDRVADAVRRYGDRAEERHLEALQAMVRDSEGELADAAARVHGALNLAGAAAVELITSPAP